MAKKKDSTIFDALDNTNARRKAKESLKKMEATSEKAPVQKESKTKQEKLDVKFEAGKNSKLVAFNIKLPRAIYNALDDEAELLGVTKKQIVLEGLKTVLKHRLYK